MYLKTMELTGFKSFPDKTLLDFTNGVTAIVGPNGSGKSNISDAIRWVLGEMRPKSLRAAGMQDVIFSGTQKRNFLNFAQVSVTIDNSDKALNIDFNEVVITRKVYRSGESEYYINKTLCRMKDVNELFMDTGLGKDGYSVVGQGKIDEIISGRPTDRRNFFEEAAGITKYRHKKEEAQRKLSQTNDNVIRLTDIIGELEVRLPTLKKAAKKAEQYEGVVSELKEAQIKNWYQNITKCKLKKEKLSEEKNTSDEEIKKLNDIITGLDENTFLLSQKRREADLLKDELYKKEKDCEFNISTYQNQIRLYEQEIQRNVQEAQNLKEQIENDDKKLKKYKILSEERQSKINSLYNNQKEIESEIKDFDEIINKIKEKEARLHSLENDISEYSRKKTDLIVDKNTKSGNISYLEELEKSFDGYQKSVREVLIWLDNEKNDDITVYGTLADIIKADKKTSLAFDAVLGGALQNIVTKDEQDAKKIIEFLKANGLGRVTFLPRDNIKEQDFDFKGAIKEKGVLGKAPELLKYDEKFKSVVTSLLGKTLIVDTYDNGAYIAKKYGNEFRIVTLKGEIFKAGGSIVGGNILKQQGFMSKSAKIDSLKENVELLEHQIFEISSQILELTKNRDFLSKETQEDKDGLTELNEKKSYLGFIKKSVYDEIESQKHLISEEDEYINEIKNKEKKINGLYEKNDSLAEDVEFKNEQIKEEKQYLVNFSKENEEVKKEKESIEKQFEQHSEKQKQMREQLVKYEQQNATVISKIEMADNEIEKDCSQMWEQYEVSYSTAKDMIGEDEINISEEQKKISILKSKIKNIGSVNIDAIEEYQQVNERFVFLSSQRDDLLNAKAQLEELIEEMQKVMKKEFKEKFEKINENFKIAFKELFGGGTANLWLTDPSDVLESGVEIDVQPPGKKLGNLSLLSGGEKAFTAIALLFSVLSLNPLPFCVFDEVEAALDEGNVYRFSEYLNKYKDNTQFILISHRRGTMENADTLYGVTMQEKGISKVVSLSMNDVLGK